MSQIITNGAFFDSTSTDIREYTQSDFSRVLGNMVTNGVCRADDLAVTAVSGLEVSAAPGACFINGFNRIFTGVTSIVVEPNTNGYIAAELSHEPDRNNIVLKAVEGTVLTQNSNVWQEPLATYAAGGTIITILTDARKVSIPQNTDSLFEITKTIAPGLQVMPWTPSFYTLNGAIFTNVNYTTQRGIYCKIGRLVNFWLRLSANLTATGTGAYAIQIEGLPFAVSITAWDGSIGSGTIDQDLNRSILSSPDDAGTVAGYMDENRIRLTGTNKGYGPSTRENGPRTGSLHVYLSGSFLVNE